MHLATIALDELPVVDGREHLPDDGLLSFFADTSEEGQLFEPIEPTDETGTTSLPSSTRRPAGERTSPHRHARRIQGLPLGPTHRDPEQLLTWL